VVLRFVMSSGSEMRFVAVARLGRRSERSLRVTMIAVVSKRFWESGGYSLLLRVREFKSLLYSLPSTYRITKS
jgi:hypothetical protein